MWAPGARCALLAIGVLCHFGDAGKGLQVVHRKVRQDLSVDIYAGLPEARHKSAVAHALTPRCRIDPGDPQRSELALLLAPVAVGIAHGALSRFLGRLVQFAPAAPSALGGLHDFLLSGVMGDAALDPRHWLSLRLKETADAGEIGGGDEVTLLQPILPLARLLGQDVSMVRMPALELPAPGGLEALHCGPFGLLLWHVAPVSRDGEYG